MKKPIILLTAALLMCACKEPQPEPQTQARLSSVTTHRELLDASGNLLTDQVWDETQQWEYDDLGRVSTITTDYTNYLGTEHSVQRNTYSADGTLAEASINDGAILAQFSYPSSSRTLIDVSTDGQPNYSIAIDLAGDRPSRIVESGASGSWSYTTDLQCDAQGNITSASCTQVGGGTTYVYGFQYQYDGHTSPTFGQFNLKEFSYKEFPTYYSPSNITRLHRTVSVEGASDQLTYSYSYTYTPEGYPATCTTEAVTSSGRREIKTIRWSY